MSSQHRLLPVYKSASIKPASIFDFEITPDVQEYLRNEGKLKMVVKDGEMFLKVETSNDLVPLQRKECPTNEQSTVYKQFSLIHFKNLGKVQSSLRIDPSVKIKQPAPILKTNQKPVESPTKEKDLKKTPLRTNDIAKSKPQTSSRNNVSQPASSKQPGMVARPPPPPQFVLSPSHSRQNREQQTHTTVSRRLLYVLPLGPITLHELVVKTNFSPSEIQAALKYVGLPYSEDHLIEEYPCPRRPENGEELWVLDYHFYGSLKLFQSRMYTDKRKMQLATNCLKVYDFLRYPSNHGARRYVEENISDLNKSSTNRSTSSSREDQERRTNRNSREETRKSENDDNNNSRERSREEHNEEFYKNLAKKFKSTYKEYESLYQTIKNSKEESSEENEERLKKLYEMHQNLSSWKERLWNSVS